MPPVILKAGMVMPNKSKIYFPAITNTVTIINAAMVAVLAILFLLALSSPSISPKKMGVLAIGFIIAKKPINTVNVYMYKSCMLFYLRFSYVECEIKSDELSILQGANSFIHHFIFSVKSSKTNWRCYNSLFRFRQHMVQIGPF